MKKLLALLLALIMTFSLGTVAFAEGEDATPDTDATEAVDGNEDESADDLAWLLDLPFWTVGPALKFAKIALKLVKVYVKLGIIFGFIDKDEIIDQIENLIADAMNQTETQEPVTGEAADAA